MAENKTTATAATVENFLAAVPDPARREDAKALAGIMERLSGEPGRMWGSSIVGFGAYHYRYESGREGTMARISFSPRAKELVLYLMDGFPGHAALLERLGKHKTGKSCLYVKKLGDVDQNVLEQLIAASLAHMDEAYPRS